MLHVIMWINNFVVNPHLYYILLSISLSSFTLKTINKTKYTMAPMATEASRIII